MEHDIKSNFAGPNLNVDIVEFIPESNKNRIYMYDSYSNFLILQDFNFNSPNFEIKLKPVGAEITCIPWRQYPKL